jgi:CrcB protein
MLHKLVIMFAAGGCGALSRYALAGVVQRATGPEFPWGTALVNVAGCFLAGLLWSVFEGRFTIGAEARAVVMIGFLGAFTTFSTFMLETSQLLRDAEYLQAFGNLAFQNGAGIVALFAGLIAGRLI